MPRVLSYTPAWLSRPSQGFDLFASRPERTAAATDPTRPTRTIAQWGSEIFVAHGNEIRWTDLVSLKDQAKRPAAAADQQQHVYRILKPQLSGDIVQLTISPDRRYLAMLTASTVHVCAVPESDYLTDINHPVMTVKTHQLGPTTHIIERRPVAAALWHPFGREGHPCLVTVTEDSIVRLWEINGDDRSSFYEPALAFDLKKLANASSAEDDLRASVYRGTAQGRDFTPDSVDMEVAAACFGGSGRYTEDPWAGTTLWIVTKFGDVYALAPLLPSRFQPPANWVSSLGVSAAAALQEVEEAGEDAQGWKQLQAAMRMEWAGEIENQDPFIPAGASFMASPVYTRPPRLGAVPRLQGPFQTQPEGDPDFDITDMVVLGLRSKTREQMEEEELEQVEFLEDEDQNSPGAVVCLLTDSATTLVYLDLDGVEGEWLPRRARLREGASNPVEEEHALVLLDSIPIQPEPTIQMTFPSFTADIRGRQAFFITHDAGVSYIYLEPWLDQLTEELSADETGTQTRVSTLLDSDHYVLEHVLEMPPSQTDSVPPNLASAVVFDDSDIGYFLVTSLNGQPFACNLDMPPALGMSEDMAALSLAGGDEAPVASEAAEVRPAFQPPQVLFERSRLPGYMEKDVEPRHRHILSDQVKFSPASFGILLGAHRILAEQTKALQDGVAELYRRAQRLQDEWRDQIKKASELSAKIDNVTGTSGEGDVIYDDDNDDGGAGDRSGGATMRTSDRIAQRMERAFERQKQLGERYNRLRAKMFRARAKELSDKEEEWRRDVDKLCAELGIGSDDSSDADGDGGRLMQRHGVVLATAERLREQAEEVLLQLQQQQQVRDGVGGREARVPDGLRRQGVARVRVMLERQDDFLAAVRERTERLRALSVVPGA